MIIEHQNTLVSTEIFENNFICNLSKCKGACCIEGDRGAPLSKKENELLLKNIEKIMPFMEAKQIAVTEIEGFSEGEEIDDIATNCLPTGECVFAFKENGILSCAIEKAENSGAIDFKKPISCHLYPIRLGKVGDFVSVNYDRWDICKDACTFGAEHKTSVFQFLKNPLIREFGEDWYNELEQIYNAWKQEKH